jgi:hypothetical protein
MILVWDSASTNALNYSLANFPDENEVLLVHEFRTSSLLEAKELGDSTKKITTETPEELLQFALPSLFESEQYPVVSMLHKLSQTKLKLFETHSDVLAYYMGDATDAFFASSQSHWINGFINCLQSCMIKTRVNIIALTGRTFDPFLFYFQNLLLCLGVKQVFIRLVYERKIAGLERLTDKLLPASGEPFFRVNDHDALMLLLVHFASHPAIRSEQPHRPLNVAAIATKLLSSELYKLLPPKRGDDRSYDGIYKALKKLSEAMVYGGLLENSGSGRRDDYRLTPLGHAYAKIALMTKEFFDETLRKILDSFELMKNQYW